MTISQNSTATNNKQNDFKSRKIIDAHCHIFPSKIQQKATQSIGAFYDISMLHQGSPEELIKSGKKINVCKYVVCSTATKSAQVTSINDFIIQSCNSHPEFIGFGTIHPDFESIEEEITRLKSANIKGIKLHPDFQRFNIDDKSAYKIYEVAQSLDLPILFHTGDDRYDYSSPSRLAKVMENFKNLRAIGAHFGGYRQWDNSVNILKKYENVYIDTSSALFALDKTKAEKMISSFDKSRIFFGTDFPMWDHCEELTRFLSLNLSENLRDDILCNNFENFINKK